MKLGKTMIKIMIWHLNDANKLFSLYFLFGGGGFPGNLVVKNLPANAGDTGLTPGWGRSPGGGYGNSFQYSCLEKPHGQRSLASCSPWGQKESDTTQHSTFFSSD